MNRGLIGLMLGFGLAVGASAADRTQSPAEGKLDLTSIAEWLPGAYDNEPQRFFLQRMKRAGDAPARKHVVIRAFESEPVAIRTLWQFSADERTNFVQMTATAADDKGIAIADSPVCTVRWARQSTTLRGTADSTC